MGTVEEQFQRWRETATAGGAQLPVELLRVEEGGTAVLAFSHGGERVATVSLTPIDGSSFFAEGLDDPSDSVEDWLTEVNSHLSDRPKLSLPDALGALCERAPKSWRAAGGTTTQEDEEEPEEDQEDFLLDDDDVATVEVGEERAAKRAAYAEDRRWGELANSATHQGSRQASQVLMREMRALLALAGEGSTKAMEIEMVGDSLYRWSVKMHASGFPACALKGDLERFGQLKHAREPAVVMDVAFPSTYPMDPPFIRVVRPRFAMYTGHITSGGSVCMQLLTSSGWLPSVSLENVFVSIRSEMVEGGGRIDFQNTKDYSVDEAKQAFRRVAERYGWMKR